MRYPGVIAPVAFAGAERGSSKSQAALNLRRGRVRGSKHAERDPSRVLKRHYGLAQIVERGGVVHVERLRVYKPRIESDIMTLSENASRHRYCFAHECLGFFKAL